MTGTVRVPISESDCKRFITVRCEYTDKKVIIKGFWSCHHLFKD